MMDISKIKWMMNRATRVLWISMDWKTPSTHLRKARAKSSMHSFQLCSIQSSSSAHLAEKGDEKTHDWKKRNEHLQEIAGFSKNTQKQDTHTNDIYIYMYIIHYIYIYIDIVCSFLSGIDRGLFWDLLCNPSSSMPVCLDCPASSASSRARSWETLLVQGPIQWLFSDSATPLVSEGVQLKLFHLLILFQLIQPWWGSPVHRRCQKKCFRAQHLGSWLGNL